MSDPNIVNPGDSTYSTPKPTTVRAADLPTMDLNRTLPRQLSTGDSRGTQTNTGENIVRDPQTNNTVINNSGYSQNTVYSDPVSNTPQVVIGKLPDNSYGMKVAQPGINVLTASDNQLVFNSEQNIFKILQTGSLTFKGFTLAANKFHYEYQTIRHNLGFAPLAQVFAQYDTPFLNYGGGSPPSFIDFLTYLPLPYDAATYDSLDFNTVSERMYYGIDDTFLYIQRSVVQGSGGSTTYFDVPVTYYLLQENVNQKSD